jgi:hypothetical protein
MSHKRKHEEESSPRVVVVVVAIVGSRTCTKTTWFTEQVDATLLQWGCTRIAVVSGDAAGVDTLARQYAAARALPFTQYRAEWGKHGKAAGIRRNSDIVAACDRLIAFPSRTGRGTQDSMRKAQRAGKPCKVIFVD